MEKAQSCRRSTERFIDATLIVILLLISISALGVALAYRWARVDVYQSTTCPCNCTKIPCTDSCCKSKGTVYMGLFDMQVQKLTVGFTVLTDVYQTLDFNSSSINVNALPVVVAGSLASGVLSFVCLFFAGINVWFSTKSAFYGPTVIYFLCFFSSVCSVTAMAAYLDFHIWTLRDGVNLVPNMYLYLFDKRLSYIPLASLDWAFYVHAGGVACSVIAFVLASRLAAVILSTTAPRTSPPKDDKSPLNLPLNVQHDDLVKSTHDDLVKSTHVDDEDDSLNELEKQPHFSEHKDDPADTATLHEETD
ncbi:hypothetical protein EMCRGX_G029516 [Ephydatia muelleri]